LRDRDRLRGPRQQRVAVLENRRRHAVVLVLAFAARAVGRLKAARARLLPDAARRIVALEVERVAGDQREELIAGVEPDAAEHLLRRDRAERLELLEDERDEAIAAGART
jgi:hypothetical protein